MYWLEKFKESWPLRYTFKFRRKELYYWLRYCLIAYRNEVEARRQRILRQLFDQFTKDSNIDLEESVLMDLRNIGWKMNRLGLPNPIHSLENRSALRTRWKTNLRRL